MVRGVRVVVCLCDCVLLFYLCACVFMIYCVMVHVFCVGRVLVCVCVCVLFHAIACWL